MSIASVGTLGTAQEKTSDTSIDLTGVTASAGDLVGVWVAMDNEGTADANTTQLSVTDSAGNGYVRVHERTESAGAANDGVVLGLFLSKLTSALSGGTITATSTSARTAKAISAWRWTADGGNAFAIQAITQNNQNNADPAAMTLSSLPSREYLLLHGFACENIVPIVTHDADYTAIDDIGTSGSTDDTNVTVDGSFRVATLTSDTVDASTSPTTTQHVQVYAAVYEVTWQNRASQVKAEVLIRPTDMQARVSQVAVEVLIKVPTTFRPKVMIF